MITTLAPLTPPDQQLRGIVRELRGLANLMHVTAEGTSAGDAEDEALVTMLYLVGDKLEQLVQESGVEV